MSIIMGLLAAAGVVIGLLWRLEVAARASREVIGVADDARGMFRRWRWQKKFAADRLSLMEDPREGAAALMVALAQSDGPMTGREHEAMTTALTGVMEIPAGKSEEMIAHARWMAGEHIDASEVVRRIAPKLREACTREQLADIVAMVESVAGAEGEIGLAERDAIERLKRALKA
ncbi:MAG: hypothetical protein GC150_06865 [Rhizobiales bacterium]|nr:hypothetical protein [Hyphomicrobiales bacterium]